MREVERRRRSVDAGPTVFTMRWVFDELFAAAGAALADHVTLDPLRRAGAPRVGRPTRGSTSSPTSRRSADAIGAFAGAAEADGFRAFCARAARDLRDARSAVPARAPRPSPLASCAAPAFGDLRATCWRISPFAHAVGGAGRALPRSAAAPAVRALRDLLRLVALRGAGDADADRACRAGRRVDRRRRHAPARARARVALATAQGATVPLWTPTCARSRRAADAPAGVVLADGETLGADARRRERRRRGARRRDCSARRRGAVPQRAARGSARCRRVTCALARDARRLSARAAQRVLLARLRAPNSTTSFERGALPASRRSMSARRTAATTTIAIRRTRERLLCLVNAPADRRQAHIHCQRRSSNATSGPFACWRAAGCTWQPRRRRHA